MFSTVQINGMTSILCIMSLIIYRSALPQANFHKKMQNCTVQCTVYITVYADLQNVWILGSSIPFFATLFDPRVGAQNSQI